MLYAETKSNAGAGTKHAIRFAWMKNKHCTDYFCYYFVFMISAEVTVLSYTSSEDQTGGRENISFCLCHLSKFVFSIDMVCSWSLPSYFPDVVPTLTHASLCFTLIHPCILQTAVHQYLSTYPVIRPFIPELIFIYSTAEIKRLIDFFKLMVYIYVYILCYDHPWQYGQYSCQCRFFSHIWCMLHTMDSLPHLTSISFLRCLLTGWDSEWVYCLWKHE